MTRRGFLRTAIASPFFLFSTPFAWSGERFSLAGTVFEKVGLEENIDPVLLYAIACVESAIAAGKQGYIQPYPWTLRYAGRPYYGKTKRDAERELRIIMLREKRPNVDIGIAQINSLWHGHRVKHLTDLLDPYTNLKVASQILNECMKRHPDDVFLAIGTYHSSDPMRAKRYARFVARVYSSVKNDQIGQAPLNVKESIA